MKILFLSPGKVVGLKGGTEKVLCNLANAMVNKGHDVLILAYDNKVGMPFFPLDEKVQFINVGNLSWVKKVLRELRTFYYGSLDEKRNKRIEFNKDIIIKKFLPVIRSFDPEVIVSFTREGTFYLKRGLDLLCPVITMYHYNAEVVLDNPFFWDSLEQSECIQTLLERDARITTETINPKRIVTIPNAVPQYIETAKVQNKKIITVGRVDGVQKRQHILLEAFNLIKDKYPEWEVEIWGDIDINKNYFHELQRKINIYNLKKFKFCGITKDVKGVLSEASIFAFPSAYEGFPLALTEAMSMGLPAVGFKNCPAVNELVVNGENGILCDDTIEAFANGLEELMSSEEKRIIYGTQAKNDMQEYAPERIWDKWENLIKEVATQYKSK